MPDFDPQLDKITAALKPGGLFVLEFFAKARSEAARGAVSHGFDILVDEVGRAATPDWGEDAAKLVRFVARKR